MPQPTMSPQSPSNRIDPTPVRLSTNVSIDRQTPRTDFGDRLQAGMQTAGGALANGAAMVAPMVPGAGIVSAAVSSVGSAGGSSPSMAHQYALSTGGASPLITTVGGGGLGGGTSGGTGGGTGTPVASLGVTDPSNVTVSGGDSMISQMAVEEQQMLKLQYAMQEESQAYQTVSNVLKTRNDTAKNSIGNIR